MESNKKSFKIIESGLTANQLSDMELSSLMGGVGVDPPCTDVPACAPNCSDCRLAPPPPCDNKLYNFDASVENGECNTEDDAVCDPWP